MRIYLSCQEAGPANELAKSLIQAGHEVVSTWHTDPSPRPTQDERVKWKEIARRNLAIIHKHTDAVVVIASPEHLSRVKCVPGGKFIEAGFALGRGVTVYTFGGIENGMLHEESFWHAEDVKELLRLLEAEQAKRVTATLTEIRDSMKEM